jgi:DNA polymerase I
VNSYYGYLGAPFHFNDYDAAEQVTLTGQELVKRIADEIEKQGGMVVEIDTDGVYFQPPPEVQTEADEIAFVERVGARYCLKAFASPTMDATVRCSR